MVPLKEHKNAFAKVPKEEYQPQGHEGPLPTTIFRTPHFVWHYRLSYHILSEWYQSHISLHSDLFTSINDWSVLLLCSYL